MTKGPVEIEIGTSGITDETKRRLSDFQDKHDDWTQKIEEAMRKLKETRDTVSATMSKIESTQAINQEACACLKQTRRTVDGRLSVAKEALELATEQMAMSFGEPGAKALMMQKSLDMARGLGNSTMGNSTVIPRGNSTAAQDSLDIEDLVRCGRGLGGAGGLSSIAEGFTDEDSDLQRALAESLQTSTVAGCHPAKLDCDEDDDEELRKAIAISLEQAPVKPNGTAALRPSSHPEPVSRPQTPLDPLRAQIAERLHGKAFMGHGDPLFMHGRAYQGPLDAPQKIWESNEAPREDHGRPEWLTASEFEDSPEVARAKVRQLAELMHLSKKTVLYTGAGISASVIGQAALSGQNKVGWKQNPREAKPTATHIALGLLGKEGMIHSWVQQNHDGLPQKAGFPQEGINEIHGSWFDPSNPVVKYSGSLHPRAHPWMVKDAETADLVIVLGTSLSGLNADQVVHKTAKRSLLPQPPSGLPDGTLAAGVQVRASPPGFLGQYKGVITAVLDDGAVLIQFDDLPDPVLLTADSAIEILPRTPPALGTVCINLQQTPRDGEMSLRLFGRSDDILNMLLKELGFNASKIQPHCWPKESRVLVPYDKDGQRLDDPKAKKMWLDLRNGQDVRITPGHNIQGSNQEMYMHIGASKSHTWKGEVRQPGVGVGRVVGREESSSSFNLKIEGVTMRLGIWWLDAAMRGAVDVLPVVNLSPAFEEEEVSFADESSQPVLAAKAFARPSSGGRPRRGSKGSTTHR